MSKIKTLLAFVALTLCGGAWAAEYQLTNATLPQNQANYDNKTLTLTLPVTAAVPSDTVVSVTTIKIGVAGHSTASNLPRFPDKIAINEATSAAGTYADDSSIGSGAGWMTYAFETAVELKAGTAYTITCYNFSDETIDDFRFRVADYNGLSDPKIITISGETRYAPFCTVVGSYESSMPTSTFAFTGNASGGSAIGFTIGGEGGDAAKKTIGPAGTQVPMIYFVSNSDKWHPWANFTAKDTFTLAAYVNTSSCTPAEGKNGIIWSMGNNGGNRVMLVKSSDGKIKLITASGANITNESTAPAFDETAGYHLYTASFSTTDGLKLTVDADTANSKSDSTATTKAADGFQIGSIFQGLQTAKFEVGNNIGVANLIGYDVVLSDSQISVLAETYPAAAMTIKSDIHQDTANKEVVLFSATTAGNHFIGVSKGTMTIPAGVEVSVPHIRCINNNATSDRATFNVAGTVNVTSESTDPNVWSDRLSYKGVLFGHYHGQGTYNITGTLNAPNTYVELCYTAEAQTLNVDGGTLTTKGIHTNNGQGTVNLSNNGRIALSTSTFMNVPVTVTGGTIAADETANYAKQLTVSSGELALEVGAEKTLTLSGGVSNSGTIAVKTGTVVIPAGSEGTVTVSAGATLKLQVTDAQIATGYTATNVTLPADTDIVFVNAQGEAVEGGSGNALAPAAVVWTGTVDGNWNTPGNWSSDATPTSETIVTIKKDASITMASDSTYKKLFIESTVSFAGTIDLSTMHDIVMSDDATITVNVASGNGKMKGITGGKVIKTGAGYLYISNATNNGTALSGTTIQIDGGTVHLDGGHNGDVNMTNPTFVLGADGALTTYGWTSVSGTLTLESDSDKSVFQNNGGKGGKIKGGPAIVKNGTGTITLLAGSDANFGAITLNGGRLDFGSDQATTVGGAISGSGAIGVNGSGLVTLNGNSNFSGGTVVTSGELKLGHANGIGGQGRAITVEADGKFDANGKNDFGAVLTLKGGVFKNSGALGNSSVQLKGLTLEADSTFNLDATGGVLNNSWNATTVDFKGHTLTKTGNGDLTLAVVTIKNPGMIDMQSGNLNLVVSGGGTTGTLKFDLTGVEQGVKKTLIQFPSDTEASIANIQIVNGSEFELAAEDNLVVVNPLPVAKIGDQEFTTIEAALAAATAEQTVTLIKNVTGDLVIPENKKVDAGSCTIGGEIDIGAGSELSLVGRETRGISGGGTLIVTSGTLYAKNKSGGYAIDGVTVKTDEGTIRLETGIGGASGNNDATSRNVKFVIGASGTLTNYGWVNFEGKIEISSDSEKSVFNGASFRGAIEVVKSGSGAVTFNLSKANDNDANKFTRLTVNDGSLKLVAAVTVEAMESGNANMKVVVDEETRTYSLVQREATELYYVGNYFNGSKSGDQPILKRADGTVMTYLTGDTIVIRDTTNGQVGCGDSLYFAPTGFPLIRIERDITFKSGTGDASLDGSAITISENKTLTFVEGVAKRGVKLGSVTLNGPGVVAVNGAVSATAIAGDATIKLTEGATLTVGTALTEGRVVSDDASKQVKFDSTTKTYSLYTPVAKIVDGEGVTTYFESVQAAIDAVGEGDVTTIQIIGEPAIPAGYCVVEGHVAKAQASVTVYESLEDEEGVTTYYATLAEAISHGAGQQVNLETDVVLASTLTMGGFVLDLKGHVLSRDVANEPVVRVVAETALQIMTTAAGGAISNGAAENAVTIFSEGQLQIVNGNLVGKVVTSGNGQTQTEYLYVPTSAIDFELDWPTIGANPMIFVSVASANVNVTTIAYKTIEGVLYHAEAAGAPMEGGQHTGYAIESITKMVPWSTTGANATVTPSAGLTTVSDVQYASVGTAVNFTVGATDGYTISAVTVNGATAEPSEGAYSYTPTADDTEVAVVVTTAVAQKTLTIPTIANTTVTVSVNEGAAVTNPGSITVDLGDTVVVTWTPNEGWFGDVASVTIALVEAGSSVTAPEMSLTKLIPFRKNEIHSEMANVSGLTEQGGKDWVKVGDTLSFKATAHTGYEVKVVIVGTGRVDPVGETYSVTATAGMAEIFVTVVAEAAATAGVSQNALHQPVITFEDATPSASYTVDVHLADGTTHQYKGTTSASGTASVIVTDTIAANTAYTYEINVTNPGTTEVVTTHGSFYSGDSAAWFQADPAKTPAMVNQDAKKTTLTLAEGGAAYQIEGDSRFEIADKAPVAGKVAVVEQTITFTSAIDVEDLPSPTSTELNNASGAITLAQDGSTLVWKCLESGAWATMAGTGESLVPESLPATRTLRFEYDAAAKTVVYSVNGSLLGQGSSTDGATMNGVSFIGQGSLTKLVGTVETKATAATVEPVKPQGVTNPVTVDPSFVIAVAGSGAKTPAEIQAAITANVADREDGLKVWQAYAMGLDAEAAKTATFTVSGKETGDANTLKLVDGLTPRVESGVTVTRKVKTAATPADLDGATATDPVSSDAEGVTIALPTTGDKVKYFKLEYSFQ